MDLRNRRLGSGLALALGAFWMAGDALAGDRWDYWDPRASIPARVIDTQLGVIALAATVAGDYRTAAVFDHLSGRFPAVAPVAVAVPVAAPVVHHVYYPPPVVEHVYYAPPRPVVVHHVHASGCGHGGYGRVHPGRGPGPGHGHGGWDRSDRDDHYGRYDDRRGGYGRGGRR